MPTIPAVPKTSAQYTASAAQTAFTYAWRILQEEDLDVYLTPVGQTPNPIADLLTLTVNYTVTGVGVAGGGTIVLTTPATLNDIITINLKLPIDRQTDFTTGGEFTGNAINFQLDRLTMISQQIQTSLEQQGLLYDVTTVLSDNRIENRLPQLTPNTATQISIWSRAAGGGLTALQIDSADDVNTLRSELASQTNGGDGALLVGYYDSVGGGKTVKVKLDEINTLQADYADKVSHASCGANLIGYNADANATTVRDELDTLGNSRVPPLTATLSGSAYSVTLPTNIFPFVAYTEDAAYKVKFDSNNPAGGVTLNINGIGAKGLKDSRGDDLPVDYITANESALVYYQTVGDQFRILTLTNGTSHTAPQNAQCWLHWDGGTTPVIQKSYNITSVSRSSIGKYVVTFSITFDSEFYSILVTGDKPVSSGLSFSWQIHGRAANQVEIRFYENFGGAWNLQDPTGASMVIFGLLA